MGLFRRARGLLAVAGASLLLLTAPALATPGPGNRGPTLTATERLAAKRYAAAGDRAYVIGTADGRFPPMGWHIRGEMGGVWAHPIKLLDGYWFALDGTWLPPATSFTAGPGYARMAFPETAGLQVTRTEVAPDGIPAVLVGLTLRSATRKARTVELALDARSELMGAYPWGWTAPSAGELNGRDTGQYDARAGALAFREPGKPWWALVGSRARPQAGEVGDGFWGPVPPEERPDYLEFGNGTGGRLRWQVRVPASGVATFWVAVAGSHASRKAAGDALRDALARPEAHLDRKVRQRQELLARTRVRLPDERLQAAFDWGKLNLADLRRTATDLAVRDVDEGRAYPEPAGRLAEATGIGAGYPDYPWLFATDGAYTAYPLMVSGQWDTAIAHLRAIRDVSRLVNGDTGKVVHEVVTDGSVYFGASDDRGNTNETAQFATAVHLVWRWTGNDAFLDEMYAFVRDGLRYVTSTLDADGDRWPEGSGMVERDGMGAEKLDVAAYTWQALLALEDMAASQRDRATAAWARRQAAGMRARFDAAWWMPGLGLYADSLCNQAVTPGDGWVNYCQAPGQQLQQRHWINATPMEVGLAPAGHAATALDNLEGAAFTGDCGLFHTGPGGGPTGAGERKCWTLPTSVMAVAEVTYGRPDAALRYLRAIADQLALEMPGALPEITPSPEYEPFVDFRERAMFMQAWSSYGIQWPVIASFLGIRPHAPQRALEVIPHVPGSWPGLEVRDLRVGRGTLAASASHHGRASTTRVSAAPGGWRLVIGHTLPHGAAVSKVLLDGRPVPFTVEDTLRGREVRVTTATGRPHTLVVLRR